MDIREKFKNSGFTHILIDEDLKNHTSFKVGGPVDVMILPETEDEIIRALGLAKQENIAYMVMGNGSNMLVKDGGIRGLIIKLNSNYNKISLRDTTLVAQAGALLSEVSSQAQANSLAGMEFASGIPGALGGAITMNAGAYGGEMKDIVKRVKVLNKQLEVQWLEEDQLDFSYRTSRVKEEGLIVLEVEIGLSLGDSQAIKDEMNRLNQERRKKQPLEFASGGSTFKRPEGYFAGKLIDDSGLRGLRYKDAQVSEKHCGFVINRGNASCEEILCLIKTVQKTVRDRFGVELEREIMLLGDD